MKNFILALSLTLAIGTVLTLNSCKKTTDNTTNDTASATDHAAVSNAMNTTADDATAAAGQTGSISGKTDGGVWRQPLCGATAVDSSGTKTLTITYDPTQNCNGITRSGKVTVQLTTGNRWRDAGSAITLTFSSLKVTDVATGGTYTLSGTHVITNVNGGFAWETVLGLSQATAIHRHTGSLQITFDDGTTRTWTIDRTRTFTNTGNSSATAAVQLSSQADGNIDATGTNRAGNTFTNSIPTPLIACGNVNCPWKVYQGEFKHQVDSRTADIVFGVNSSGTHIGSATMSSTDCSAMGYQVTVSGPKGSKTKFVGYWH